MHRGWELVDGSLAKLDALRSTKDSGPSRDGKGCPAHRDYNCKDCAYEGGFPSELIAANGVLAKDPRAAGEEKPADIEPFDKWEAANPEAYAAYHSAMYDTATEAAVALHALLKDHPESCAGALRRARDAAAHYLDEMRQLIDDHDYTEIRHHEGHVEQDMRAVGRLTSAMLTKLRGEDPTPAAPAESGGGDVRACCVCGRAVPHDRPHRYCDWHWAQTHMGRAAAKPPADAPITRVPLNTVEAVLEHFRIELALAAPRIDQEAYEQSLAFVRAAVALVGSPATPEHGDVVYSCALSLAKTGKPGPFTAQYITRAELRRVIEAGVNTALRGSPSRAAFKAMLEALNAVGPSTQSES